MRLSPPSLAASVLVVLVVSTASCARVHPHLSLPEMSLGEPSFFPTIEALTASPIVGGNNVEVLLNGKRSSPRCSRRSGRRNGQ